MITRPDGRRVAIHDLTLDAPADAPVVLLCHVAPGSGAFDPDPNVTAQHRVRLVSVDRPGYGESDPVIDTFATVVLAADDAAAALEAVGGRVAGVAGWSAGGRVALALAQRRPDLVDRVAVVGTPAPDEEVPWIPPEHRAGLEALRGLPPTEVHAALTGMFEPALAALSGDDRLGLTGVGPADAEVLAGAGVRERLARMMDDALAQGARGMVADIAGYSLQPWGFDPADVTADVLLAYGTDDAIGAPHADWWAAHLPRATQTLVPDVGHLVVVPTWDLVLRHLTATR